MTSLYRRRRKLHDERDSLTPSESRFQWMAKKAEASMQGVPLFLSTVGAVGLGTYSLFTSGLKITVVIFGIIFALAGVFLTHRRQVSQADLEREISKLESGEWLLRQQLDDAVAAHARVLADIQEAVDRDKQAAYEVLAEAARSICYELGVWDTSTRLSLYCHEEGSQEFIRLARVSDNPALESTGRFSYPSNQGFIAEVWQEKEAILVKMPHIRRHWENYQIKQYGLGSEVVSRLTMHSRCMVGARIDYKGTRAGVVIIESTIESRLTPAHLDNLKSSMVLTEALSRLFIASKFALRNDVLAERS